MSWEDRLQQAVYTNGNTSQVFDFEDVATSFTNRGAAFNYPNAQGTYIQRSGSTGRSIPMVCFFHGEDYDIFASNFMLLLRRGGVGKLQHPIYGTINVVPLGDIQRSDKLKTAAGVATISLTFFETTGIVFPTNKDDPETEVTTAIYDHVEAAANEYFDQVDLSNQIKKIDHRDKYATKTSLTYNETLPLMSDEPALLSRFNATYNSIIFNLDELLNEPITLARQTSALLNMPSFTSDVVTAKLAAFTRLIDVFANGISENANELASNSLFTFGFVGASVLSVVETEFETQKDALDAAVFVLETFDKVNTWYDENLKALDVIDPGRAYSTIQDATAIAAGFLIQISFTLKQERTIVLTAPRNMIELVYELYGVLDEQYDFFLNSNNLTGDEILEIPAGTTIRYYV